MRTSKATRLTAAAMGAFLSGQALADTPQGITPMTYAETVQLLSLAQNVGVDGTSRDVLETIRGKVYQSVAADGTKLLATASNPVHYIGGTKVLSLELAVKRAPANTATTLDAFAKSADPAFLMTCTMNIHMDTPLGGGNRAELKCRKNYIPFDMRVAL